jgi:hypothetical protein
MLNQDATLLGRDQPEQPFRHRVPLEEKLALFNWGSYSNNILTEIHFVIPKLAMESTLQLEEPIG